MIPKFACRQMHSMSSLSYIPVTTLGSQEPTSKRKEVSATSPALHATVNFNSTKV